MNTTTTDKLAKFASEAQLARMRLANNETTAKAAKQGARMAKRRLKETKQAVRAAKKAARLAKLQVLEAREVLAAAEAKLEKARARVAKAQKQRKAVPVKPIAAVKPAGPRSAKSAAGRAAPQPKPARAGNRSVGVPGAIPAPPVLGKPMPPASEMGTERQNRAQPGA